MSGNNKEREPMRYYSFRIAPLVLLFAVSALVSVATLCFDLWLRKMDGLAELSTRAIYGDQFGMLNTLFTGLAFAGFLYALWMQREDLRMQREEMRDTRKEMERQTERFEEQIIATSMTSHLNMMRQLLEQLSFKYVEIDKLRTSNSLSDNFKLFVSILSRNTSPNNTQKLCDLFAKFEELFKNITPWAELAYAWDKKIAQSELIPNKKLEYRRGIILGMDEEERLCLTLYYVRNRRLECSSRDIEMFEEGDPRILPSLLTFCECAKQADSMHLDKRTKALHIAHFLISRANGIINETGRKTGWEERFAKSMERHIKIANDVYKDENVQSVWQQYAQGIHVRSEWLREMDNLLKYYNTFERDITSNSFSPVIDARLRLKAQLEAEAPPEREP